MKNQAAFLVDKQRLELMDCDMPSVSDTDVLVEVAMWESAEVICIYLRIRITR